MLNRVSGFSPKRLGIVPLIVGQINDDRATTQIELTGRKDLLNSGDAGQVEILALEEQITCRAKEVLCGRLISNQCGHISQFLKLVGGADLADRTRER